MQYGNAIDEARPIMPIGAAIDDTLSTIIRLENIATMYEDRVRGSGPTSAPTLKEPDRPNGLIDAANTVQQRIQRVADRFNSVLDNI